MVHKEERGEYGKVEGKGVKEKINRIGRVMVHILMEKINGYIKGRCEQKACQK